MYIVLNNYPLKDTSRQNKLDTSQLMIAESTFENQQMRNKSW